MVLRCLWKCNRKKISITDKKETKYKFPKSKIVDGALAYKERGIVIKFKT